jgi:hypothetical protein
VAGWSVDLVGVLVWLVAGARSRAQQPWVLASCTAAAAAAAAAMAAAAEQQQQIETNWLSIHTQSPASGLQESVIVAAR